MPGMSVEGFVPETFEGLRFLMQERIRGEFGPVPLDDSTIEGLVIDIFVEAMIKLWEIAEVSYSALDIDKAVGAALDALCTLVGVFRRPASFSVGENIVIVTGDPTTVVTAGSEASTGPTGTVVEIIDDTTINATTVWTDVTAYNEGDIRTNGGHVYYAHDDVPDTVDPPVHTARSGFAFFPGDPPAYWTWVGEGTGHGIVELARATITGPRAVSAFALVDRETNISGWNGVGNFEDFEIGRNQETDEELRVSREAQIQAPGTSPKKAIRAALLAADPVNIIQVTVFMNTTDSTNADGMPPHSVEALVRGGEDQLIFDTLLANVAAGIATHGGVDGFAVDDEGTSEAVSFSRPTEKDIYVIVTLTKDPDEYPEDGDDQVKAAIVAYGQAQNTGRDVVSSALIGAVFKDVDGVLDITQMFIGLAPAPVSGTTIPISLRELAVHSTTRITVNSSDGVP